MFADSFPDVPVIPDDDVDYESSDDDSANDSFRKNISTKKVERQMTETMGFEESSAKHAGTSRDSTGKFSSGLGDDDKKSSSSTSKFTFHNFGYHPQPFRDLLDKLSTLKQQYRLSKTEGNNMGTLHHRHHHHHHHHTHHGHHAEHKGHNPKAFTSTTGTMFDINAYQKDQLKKDKHRNAKISQFRPKEPLWNGTMTPDSRMLKELYRVPCSDPSGQLIRGVKRDEAKGAKPWKACETDKNIPPPTFEHCAESYQLMLTRHMDEVIARVEREYAKMPQNTLKQSELKASVGADLANLRREREEIRIALQNAAQHLDEANTHEDYKSSAKSAMGSKS